MDRRDSSGPTRGPVENLDPRFERIGFSDMRYVCGPQPQHRDDLKQHVEWLRQVAWQVFCTFTFAWSVSDAQGERVFATFVDRMERHLHCPLGYVRGDEVRFSGYGKPAAPRHYHVLFAAERKLEPSWVADMWTALAGARANGAAAHVREYDPNRNAIAYTLKLINQTDGNWSFKNLDLFIRGANLGSANCRARRRLSRHRHIHQDAKATTALSIESEAPRVLQLGRKRGAKTYKNRRRQPSNFGASAENSVLERTDRVCRLNSVLLDIVLFTAVNPGFSSRSPPYACKSRAGLTQNLGVLNMTIEELQCITQFVRTVRNILEQDGPMTLHQLFWRLVSAEELHNNVEDYEHLGRAMTWLREEGQCPSGLIVDRSRAALTIDAKPRTEKRRSHE